MPNWEGIEDASAVPVRIWLVREKETDEWQPLRKADCQALNQYEASLPTNSTALVITATNNEHNDDDHNNNNNNNSSGSRSKINAGHDPALAIEAAASFSSTGSSSNTTSRKQHSHRAAVTATAAAGGGVIIEGGRSTAFIALGHVAPNFTNTPLRLLSSATWFVKEERPSTTNKDLKYILHPMSRVDCDKIEDLYQRAVSASSSLGEGIDSVLKEELMLEDGESKVSIVKLSNGALTMKKRPKGWFGGATNDLQRGFGNYKVQGEEEELTLGPVRQLVFIIHGIGEAMWSRSDVKVASLQEQTNQTRLTLQRKQVEEWKKQCDKAKKAGLPEPSPPNRIEVLPIEWYDRIHSSSNSLMKSLKATTLQTIPALRAIANDVVFDVLMYMTPNFCQAVLECVTTQIEDLFLRFQEIHPTFLSSGGKCSLIGHSLGSVIAWDLLSVLKDTMEPKEKRPSETHGGVNIATDQNNNDIGYQAYAREEHANSAKHGTWGPSLPKPLGRTLPFIPDFTVFLGSPIGLFLTLRGAHAVFDDMRVAAAQETLQKAQVMVATPPPSPSNDDGTTEETNQPPTTMALELPAASTFSLPSGSVYNIFHPSDPVAYRIEPLLLPPDVKDSEMPPPEYLRPQGQGVRFHVKAKLIGDEIRKSLAAQRTHWSSLLESAVSVFAAANTANATESDRRKLEVKEGPLRFPLGGKSQRVDFQLQPGVIDNEYFSAVTAHSNYFFNQDFLDFLIDLADVREESNCTALVLAGSASSM